MVYIKCLQVSSEMKKNHFVVIKIYISVIDLEYSALGNRDGSNFWNISQQSIYLIMSWIYHSI